MNNEIAASAINVNKTSAQKRKSFNQRESDDIMVKIQSEYDDIDNVLSKTSIVDSGKYATNNDVETRHPSVKPSFKRESRILSVANDFSGNDTKLTDNSALDQVSNMLMIPGLDSIDDIDFSGSKRLDDQKTRKRLRMRNSRKEITRSDNNGNMFGRKVSEKNAPGALVQDNFFNATKQLQFMKACEKRMEDDYQNTHDMLGYDDQLARQYHEIRNQRYLLKQSMQKKFGVLPDELEEIDI